MVEAGSALKSGAGQEVSTGMLSVNEKFTLYETKSFCVKYWQKMLISNQTLFSSSEVP